MNGRLLDPACYSPPTTHVDDVARLIVADSVISEAARTGTGHTTQRCVNIARFMRDSHDVRCQQLRRRSRFSRARVRRPSQERTRVEFGG